MKRKEPNLKGLGLMQLSLIYKMINEDLVIRVRRDHDQRPTITLEDERGDNTYESIPIQTMRSLGKRRIFACMGWMPALFVTIDTYSIKGRVKELLQGDVAGSQTNSIDKK